MTDRLTPTEVNDHFDQDGRRPGCYALRLLDPFDDPHAIRTMWEDQYDANPPAGFCERLAEADRFVYVGSHGQSVYERVMQHAEGKKSSTIMNLWPPVGIVAWWPEDNPKDMEWGHANEMANKKTCVWQDGEWL